MTRSFRGRKRPWGSEKQFCRGLTSIAQELARASQVPHRALTVDSQRIQSGLTSYAFKIPVGLTEYMRMSLTGFMLHRGNTQDCHMIREGRARIPKVFISKYFQGIHEGLAEDSQKIHIEFTHRLPETLHMIIDLRSLRWCTSCRFRTDSRQIPHLTQLRKPCGADDLS